MSEIEKMYENANIEKEVIEGCYDYYSKLGIDIWKENDCRGKNCDTCKKDKSIKRYPPFTTERVLKVMVFFLNKGIGLNFSVEENTKISVENFKECIAYIVSKYWQSLTSEEKQQIKEILE